VRYQVLIATSMKIRASWDIVSCSLVGVDQRFGGVYCLHYQGNEFIALMVILGFVFLLLIPNATNEAYESVYLFQYCIVYFLCVVYFSSDMLILRAYSQKPQTFNCILMAWLVRVWTRLNKLRIEPLASLLCNIARYNRILLQHQSLYPLLRECSIPWSLFSN
jgi:hypothetical protein